VVGLCGQTRFVQGEFDPVEMVPFWFKKPSPVAEASWLALVEGLSLFNLHSNYAYLHKSSKSSGYALGLKGGIQCSTARRG
jgi:hypothetical protein